MFPRVMPYWFTFVLILYMRLFLESHAGSDICSKCKCDYGVNCANLGLTSVPYGIPKSTTYLYLGYNKITKLQEGAFDKLENLQILNLTSNNITNIAKESFLNLTSLAYLYLKDNSITSLQEGTFQNLHNLWQLDLSGNNITDIAKGTFQNVPSLTHLYLSGNDIKTFEKGIVYNHTNLKTLDLSGNKLTSITSAMFHNLRSLTKLYLQNNQIRNYEDGSFLFLPDINEIDLSDNNNMMCGCHLPAIVNYMKKEFNIRMAVWGKCIDLDNNQSKVIGIMEYSQCENYSLFQRKLQCQTCSGVMCNDSKVTSCPGKEPVCRYTISMKGVSLKLEKSCSTYKQCVEAERNNTFTCNKWASGTSCVACCTGNLCNKKDFVGWTNSFVFYLIHKKNPYGDSGYQIPAENISIAMEREFLNMTGAFKVKYCGSKRSAEFFTIDCLVLSHISKDQVWNNIYNTLNTSQTLRNMGIQSRNMELIDDMYCKEDTTKSDTLYWPRTKVGATANITCHANVATRRCSSRTVVHQETPTSSKCSPFTGIWQEPDMSQCNNTDGITRQLKDIKSKEIDKQNIKNFSKTVLDLTENSVYFEGKDVDLAVGILENMVPLISNVSANITLNILLSINNMINTPEKSLVKAEQSNGIVNRMLDIIESIPEKIPLEGEQITVLYSNIGIGVAKVEEDTFNGLFYGISYGTNETEPESVIYNYSDRQEEDILLSFISLPKSLFKRLKDENRSPISRISLFSMQDGDLYEVIQESNSQANNKINSHIIAANIPNIPITDLDEPVNISFNVIDQNATNPQCVYWDNSAGQNPHWSTEGCSIHEYVPGEKVVCFCNHLTSFAVLMDVYQNEESSIKNVQILSLISNIGCGISFVFLILTIIIHVCFKNLWKLMPSKILVNLCSSLAITNLIFVVGMQEYAAGRIAVCKTVAALLHYFLMTSLMWMTVEAGHVCMALFVVSNTYQNSFMMRSSILAWGLPAAIVIITLVINYTNNYIRRGQVCWLSDISFYAAFLSPVVIILIFNLTTFCLVIWRLISMQTKKKLENKTRKVRVFGIVGLFFLLGLSWILAFFAFGAAAEAFKYLFVIFNTLQGVFIFIFYCMYKKDTRDELSQRVCKRRKDRLREVTKNKRSSSSGIEIEDKTAETNL